MMFSIKSGVNRVVFVLGRYAFKFPNFMHSHLHFIHGCYANCKERDYYRVHSKSVYEGNMAEHVAPSLFCSWFGLVQVQSRCDVLDRDLTDEEKEFFVPLCGLDNKRSNFGLIDGKLVCLDYQ